MPISRFSAQLPAVMITTPTAIEAIWDGLSSRPELTMIVVAPAGGCAALSKRSTPPVRATERATAPILAGVTPCW